MFKKQFFILMWTLYSGLTLLNFPLQAVEKTKDQNLGEFLKTVIQNNLEIKQAYHSYKAESARVGVKNSLPDPRFQVGFYLDSVETRVGPQKRSFSLMQNFPFPGTLKIAGRGQRAKAQAERQKFFQKMSLLIVETKMVFSELFYLSRALEAGQLQLEIILKLQKEGFRGGVGKRPDLSSLQKGEVERTQLELDLLQLAELKKVYQVKLQTLCGQKEPIQQEDFNLPPMDPLPKLSILQDVGGKKRIEIQIGKQMVEFKKASSQLARKETLPNFNLFANLIETGDRAMAGDESGKDAMIIGVGVSLPIFSGKNRAIRTAGVEDYNASKNSLESLRNTTQSDISEMYYKAIQSKRLMVLYQETLIPQAQQGVESAELMFRQGELPFSSLLETQINYHNFTLASLRAQADYFQFSARLQHLVGGDFPQFSESEKDGN